MEGKRFYKLVVVSSSNRRFPSGAPLWECLCDCGKTTFTTAAKLNAGKAKSCGCSKQEYRDYTQQVANTDKFRLGAVLKHGAKYDYSKVDYVRSNLKVCILCTKHGEFYQTPNKHLNGSGCPGCVKSGFKQTLDGNVYIFVFEDIVKVGITNREIRTRLTQQRSDSGKKFMPFKAFPLSGRDCLEVEKIVLRWLNTVAVRLNERFIGSSECFVGITPSEVEEFIENILRVSRPSGLFRLGDF